MSFKDCLKDLDELLNSTEDKSKIKYYNKFTVIFKNLDSFKLEQKKKDDIISTFNSLSLDVSKYDKISILKGKYSDFKKFLQKEYSILEQGYCVGIGMNIGILFGIIFSNFTGFTFGMSNETSGGIIGGLLFGMFFGFLYENKLIKEKRIIK